MILFTGVMLCLECWLIGFAIPVPARFKAFTADHMEQFTEEYKGKKAGRGGWPDGGEGRFADKLEYKAWY
jgi:hypothetical protein